jgi:hypothetical protein
VVPSASILISLALSTVNLPSHVKPTTSFHQPLWGVLDLVNNTVGVYRLIIGLTRNNTRLVSH